jgi:hypothetical protein
MSIALRVLTRATELTRDYFFFAGTPEIFAAVSRISLQWV